MSLDRSCSCSLVIRILNCRSSTSLIDFKKYSWRILKVPYKDHTSLPYHWQLPTSWLFSALRLFCLKKIHLFSSETNFRSKVFFESRSSWSSHFEFTIKSWENNFCYPKCLEHGTWNLKSNFLNWNNSKKYS